MLPLLPLLMAALLLGSAGAVEASAGKKAAAAAAATFQATSNRIAASRMIASCQPCSRCVTGIHVIADAHKKMCRRLEPTRAVEGLHAAAGALITVAAWLGHSLYGRFHVNTPAGPPFVEQGPLCCHTNTSTQLRNVAAHGCAAGIDPVVDQPGSMAPSLAPSLKGSDIYAGLAN